MADPGWPPHVDGGGAEPAAAYSGQPQQSGPARQSGESQQSAVGESQPLSGQLPQAAPSGWGRLPHLSSASAFARVRSRWLLAFVFAGVATMLVVGVVLAALGADIIGGELFSSLLYVPLVAWALFVQWRNKVRLRALFAVPHIGSFWWVVVGLVVLLLIFSIGASSITSALVPDYVASADLEGGTHPLVLLVTIAVIPPFVEELTFRGLLLERWAVKWRIGVAVVVQAVCFGILHVDPIGAGVFGAVMALMYLRTRTLWVPIVMHALNNGLVVVAVVLGGDGADSAEPGGAGELILFGLLAMAVSGPLIGWFIYKNWPGPDCVTPYEAAELGEGALPPRRLGRVTVGGVSRAASVSPTALVVSADRAARHRLYAVPYDDVSTVAVTPDWRHLLVMGAGGSLQLSFDQRTQRARNRAMHAVAQRVEANTGVAAQWWR